MLVLSTLPISAVYGGVTFILRVSLAIKVSLERLSEDGQSCLPGLQKLVSHEEAIVR